MTSQMGTESLWGGWKKLRCANKFMDIQNLSCVISDKCIVITDECDYRDDWRWNDDQIFLGLAACSVIILRHAQLLGKYGTYNSDGHVFGETFMELCENFFLLNFDSFLSLC